MALINCPECGKQVSSNALSCPNCGNPIGEPLQKQIEVIVKKDDDEYLCCPKCASKELHAEHKGFSGGKALAGAIVTGGIGLLAGTIGSRDVQITCLKCGNKFNAGDAKIEKRGVKADHLEHSVLNMLCDGNTIGAQRLYKSETNCSDHEAYSYIYKLLERVPNAQTPEQKEKMRKYYEELQNKKGCMGVFLGLIAVSSFLLIYFI
jgi:RNA polymerase subunit RPABC4/transcription elongation factor Spt4